MATDKRNNRKNVARVKIALILINDIQCTLISNYLPDALDALYLPSLTFSQPFQLVQAFLTRATPIVISEQLS